MRVFERIVFGFGLEVFVWSGWVLERSCVRSVKIKECEPLLELRLEGSWREFSRGEAFAEPVVPDLPGGYGLEGLGFEPRADCFCLREMRGQE